MREFIKAIEIEGLFGQGDVSLDFEPGVNVLTGHNGSFKTTILQILANILHADFDRFAFLDFRSIHVEISRGDCIMLKRFRNRDEITGATDYLIRVKSDDSFEVLSTNEIEMYEPSLLAERIMNPQKSKEQQESPKSNYKESDFREARDNGVNTNDILPVTYLPAFRATVDAMRTISRRISPLDIINSVRFWLTPFVPQVDYPTLGEVEQALTNQCITQTQINSYVHSVNKLFEKKQLVVDLDRTKPRLPIVRVEHNGGGYSKLSALSSGEREIVILLYTAAIADPKQILLIDEPENSLHVSWQRKLLNLMDEGGHYHQVIACTHSPVIASRYTVQEIVVEQNHQDLSDDILNDF